MRLLQALLSAVLPLLTRRVLAAERQAEACERQEDLLRQYLAFSDPAFRDHLLGIHPEAEALAEPPDVYADHGLERDLKAQRLEELRALWFAQHGELLDDERLVVEYERLYEDAEARLNPDAEGVH